MKYGSVCSGIEAATTAWHALGWQPVFFSEIEPFPCSVLAHHWPHVPNLGDLTQHESWKHDPIDLLVGGTPCQAFSVAGLREGLADPRGNLTLTFLALVKRTRPRWVVWENVPGVLSDRTNAFGHFLSGLAELGYGWAYRVLDAQYFGVAQRRRRVFVVACAGADWRRAAAVLFEPDCLRGNPPPSRQAGQRPAGTISSRTTGGGGLGTDFDLAGGLQPVVGTLNANGKAFGSATQQDAESGLLVAFGGNNRTGPIDAAAALNAKGGSGRMDFESETFIAHTTGAGFWQPGAGTLRAREQESHEHLVTHSLRAEGFDAGEDGTGRGTPLIPVVAGAICKESFSGGAGGRPEGAAAGHFLPVAFQPRVARNGRGYTGNIVNALQAQSGETGKGDAAPCVAFGVTIHGTDKTARAASFTDTAGSLRTKPPGSQENSSTTAVLQSMRVRRLTPRECERLQGFPDDHTLVPHRGKPAADGPRYKAIGNSMAVPVMAWIGRRIRNLESLS